MWIENVLGLVVTSPAQTLFLIQNLMIKFIEQLLSFFIHISNHPLVTDHA